MKTIILNTPKGYGNLEGFHISELGFLMVKLSYEDGTYSTYNLGIYDPEENPLSKIINQNGNK